MRRFLVLAASALVAFPDFAVGCFIVTIVGSIMGASVPLWYLPIGGVLALLPDFDILEPVARQFITGHTMTGNHREATVLHRPLLILSAVTVMGYVVGGEYWAITAFLCVFAHYVHDARETGSDGLAWFWPVSHKYWWVGGSYEQRYSEPGPWLENTWLKPSGRSVTELCIGSLAMGMALTISLDPTWAIGFIGILWISMIMVWLLWKLESESY